MTLKSSVRVAAPRHSLRTQDGRLVAAGVKYLNARPILDPLDEAPFSERFALFRETSAETARQVAEEEAALGLMPVAAAASLGGIELVPGVCVSSFGPVRSVLLLADAPLEELQEVILDSTSRTSVVLARLILAARRRAPFAWLAASPEEAVERVKGKTAAVVIGDVALHNEHRFAHSLDLGLAWRELTELPFVYAAWCSREGTLDARDSALLQGALSAGLERRRSMARDHSQRTGEDESSTFAYLTQAIRYELGEQERAGLQEFFDRANAAGLLPASTVRLVGDGPRKHAVPLAAKSVPSLESEVEHLLTKAADGARLSVGEAELLYARAPLIELGLAADAVRKRKNPAPVVTYIVDRNINYTNVCTTSCRFCAFYRPLNHPEAWTLSREQLGQKMQEVVDAGGVQILLQGGLNPELRIEWYEELFRWIKSTYKLGLHALSPEEILHLSRLESLSVRRVLERLNAAGMDSLPGGGAEILTDRVRRAIARAKCTSEEWLSVMRVAHQLGLRSSATMMYGTTDNERDRVLHLLKLRDLQDETGGFTVFFCWDYQHESGVKQLAGETGTNYYLRTQALARLFLDNFEHVGASWVTQGPSVGEIALRFGADDFGSVMFEENVVSSAGTTYRIDATSIEQRIHAAGFRSVRRNVHYEWLGEPR